MRVLFTGASSFTGFWFARELAARGHEVATVFQNDRDAYADLRGTRVAEVSRVTAPVWNCSFGDERFAQLIERGGDWDVLCHHAADVRDYKNPKFDVCRAVDSNTRNAKHILELLREQGCSRFVVTGSVFEAGEGAGSEGCPSFSPYGLSKELTWRILNYYAMELRMAAGKFVVPNPFGPYEEARFTAYLMNTWKSGKVATVQTPDYVRDNIHVSLLSHAYCDFVEDMGAADSQRSNPSGYVENQGRFTSRLAEEVRCRTSLECAIELAEQTEFPEPRIRINTDPAAAADWSEATAWDDFVAYYTE